MRVDLLGSINHRSNKRMKMYDLLLIFFFLVIFPQKIDKVAKGWPAVSIGD